MITYFLKNNVNSYIKIGITKDIDKRKPQIIGSCSFIELSLVYSIEGNFEYILHEHYKTHRKEGEWFDIIVNPEEIKAIVDKYKPIKKQQLNAPKDYHRVKKGVGKIIISLSTQANKMIWYILDNIQGRSNTICIHPDRFLKYCGYSTTSKVLYYNAIKELTEVGLICKPNNKENKYVINPSLLFTGDRVYS